VRRAARIASLPPLFAALLTLAPNARAIEIESVAGEPMAIDVTNTAIFNYHFNNRNDQSEALDGNVGTLVDDHYGELLDRLNVQVGWWRLRLGLRLDVATFMGATSRLDAEGIAQAEVGPDASGATVNAYANQIRRELNTRFLNTVYPSKLWVDYTHPGLQVTLGDFYAQLGRGLVFSVRKIDELAVDTTVRGGKIVFNRELGPLRVGATALAGQMNPLRVDETTGRRLHGAGSPLFFGFPTANDLTTFDFNEVGTPYRLTEAAQPSYLEDTVIAGRVEAGMAFAQLGVNGSILVRSKDPTCVTEDGAACEAAPTIRTFSGSLNVPSIAKHGDIYLEVAGQKYGDSTTLGYAVYGSANAYAGPVTVSLEGKHYRSFLPLAANIGGSVGFDAAEFNVIAYNQPPTVEPIYVELIGSPNVCITGGRGRVDVRFTRSASVYGWLGRYTSYSEHNAQNTSCDTSDKNQTNTWDAAIGSELDFEGGKSHTRAWVGARATNLEVPTEGYVNVIGATDAFYQEGYLRYDVVKHITGPFTVQLQGFHRRRYEPSRQGTHWYEGENYTALQWSPHISAIIGYEYLTREGCDDDDETKICHYVNGGVQWKSGSHEKVWQQLLDTVQVFVGQRRGAVRCVSGVCRQFPPFEGAKLEVVSRF
jgi:hypothetical protein